MYVIDTSWEEFLSWRCKHPENWTEKEVLDWLFYSAEMSGVDTTNLHGEAFRITGRDLCRMNLEDFQRIEPQYGQYFYSLFRQLLNGRKWCLFFPLSVDPVPERALV